MAFSYWEQSHYDSKADVVVLGSGIVGLSTAIHLKTNNPSLEVLVVDRQWPPHGASTKNAGFMCFGSPTEILDDIVHFGEDLAKEIFSARYLGRETLFSLLPPEQIDYIQCGGIELLNKFHNEDISIESLNNLLNSALGIKDYFSEIKNAKFKNFHERAFLAKQEGKVNPLKIVFGLKAKADLLGVNFLFKEVKEIDWLEKKMVFIDDACLQVKKLAITLNAFAKSFLADYHFDINTARNNVIVTSEIEELQFEEVIHIDKGYIYMRKVGKRVLLGGARNLFGKGEYTADMGVNEDILMYLRTYLKDQIGVKQSFTIDYSWAGILGVGANKKPIIEEVAKDLFAGVRLGGMGVAIGAKVGKDLARLMFPG